jgi:hypothetical protein
VNSFSGDATLLGDAGYGITTQKYTAVEETEKPATIFIIKSRHY